MIMIPAGTGIKMYNHPYWSRESYRPYVETYHCNGSLPEEPCWGAVKRFADNEGDEEFLCQGHAYTNDGGKYVHEPVDLPKWTLKAAREINELRANFMDSVNEALVAEIIKKHAARIN